MQLADMIGYCEEVEYLALQKYAELVTEGVILEIGTHQGKSAFYMASVAHVPVYTVDKYDYYLFDSYKEQLGLDVIKIQEDSTEVKWHRSLGLLFIDGAHIYEMIKNDFRRFEPSVMKGGFLLIHDFAGGPTMDGVPAFLEEIQDELNKRFETLETVDNLLCLQKK